MAGSQGVEEVRETQETVAESTETAAVERTRSEEIAYKMELLLDRFPKSNGKRWRGVDVARATGDEVSSSYFSGIRRARFDHPGMKHLSLIADVIGFPFELWRIDPEYWEDEIARHEDNTGRQGAEHANYSYISSDQVRAGNLATRSHRESNTSGNDPFVEAFGLYQDDISIPESPRLPAGDELANLLNILFESKPDPRTERPYTNDRVARLSRDRITSQQIARMRAGGQTEPPAEITLIALSQIFGIPVSYWYVSHETRPVIDLDHLEEALTQLLADDRLIVIRSGRETAELTAQRGTNPDSEKADDTEKPNDGDGEKLTAGQDGEHDERARSEHATRKLVAELLNRLANEPGPEPVGAGKRTSSSSTERTADRATSSRTNNNRAAS